MTSILDFIRDLPLELAIPLIIVLRTLSIVIPPIQGWAIDAVALIRLGWWKGLIVSEVGVLIGTSVSFLLARRFSNRFANKSFKLRIDAIIRRLPELETFSGLLVIRLLTNPLYDLISYAAGFTKITFSKFILSSFISSIPTMFILFYFGETIINHGIVWIALAFAFLVVIGIWWNRRAKAYLDLEPKE